jgi:hypothetical protein
MGTKLNFEDFLKRTEKTYQSIDSRAALMRINNSWAVALLVLRFSPEDTGEVEAKHKDLEQKWNNMLSTAHFKIAMDAVNFREFNFLCDNLKRGEYKSSKLDLVAELRHSMPGYSLDLFSLEEEFPSYYGFLLEKEREWPCFSKSSGEHLEQLYKSKEIENELWDAGLVFGNGLGRYVLIREILEVRDYQPGVGFNVLVYAPFLAKMERDVNIGVKFHKAFDNELRLSGYLEDRQGGRIKKRFGPYSPSSQESKDSGPYLKLWESPIELEGLTSSDHLSMFLSHRIPENLLVNELYKAGSSLMQPGKLAPAINPLAAALQRFVGEDISSYLKVEPRIDRPQDKYELKVCRLLGLCDFSVVRLGGTRFDTLKDKNDPEVDRGKCDILAYSENRNCLLVVECTKNLPEDRDIRGAEDACATLQEEVFQGTNVELKPAFFVERVVTQDKDLKGGRIIDAKEIKDLINCLSSGESPEQLFFKFFVSPSNVEVGQGLEF